MLKKIDKWQVATLASYMLLVGVMMLVPYREVIETGDLKHGYRHLMNWIVIIYGFFVAMKPFGLTIYNIMGHSIGLAIAEGSGVYFKLFIFKENYNVVVTGLLSEIVVLGLFILIVNLESSLYFTGNEKELNQ